MEWLIYGILGVGIATLFGVAGQRRGRQRSIASESGLEPAADLVHVATALQRTALWSLAEGGFERHAVHGVVSRGGADIEVTAFDLETLRERRGEWAWLPVEPPFRIGGIVSIVVCQVDRAFPHALLKRAGHGDKLADDPFFGRSNAGVKTVRDVLGLERSHAAELPPGLSTAPVNAPLPEGWRAYATVVDPALAAPDVHAALVHARRRDLVVELIEDIVVVYPAALDVSGADAFADLIETALAIALALRHATLSPRGVEP